MENIKLKFFGQLVEITGVTDLHIPFIADTTALIQSINKTFPELKQSPYRLAVNMKVIQGNVQLQPGSEVAFLPPFAGG